MKTTLLTCAFALSVALGPATATAALPEVDVLGQRVDPERMSVEVGFADLDLTAAADQGRLTSRVRGAVREVCAPLGQAAQRIEHSACSAYAWNGAEPQLRQAFARARYAALHGTAVATAAIVISAPPAL